MKNLVILGAVALLLFSLSAALSLWLNQSKQNTVSTEKSKEEGKVLPKAATEPPKDDHEKKTIPPIVPPKVGTPEAGVLDRQRELERKALQITLVLADVQAQREATDALLKQVAAELKTAAKAPAPDETAERLRKEREEATKNERLNLIKLAAIYDAMTPEGAAPNIKSMAESGAGKLEQVAQILMLMKERNAARLMEALNEPPLVAQLMDKMRLLRAQGAAIAPPAAPAPSPLPSFGTGGTPSSVRPVGAP